MNTEKKSFRIIAKHIARKEYLKAIKKIDELILVTSYIRKCINLKAICLLELGKYNDVIELYKDSFPYIMIDEEDIITLKNLAHANRKSGNIIRAKKYENSYDIFNVSAIKQESLLLFEDMESKQFYKQFINGHNNSKTIIEDIITDNLQLTRMTEVAVFYALMKRLNHEISHEIYKEINKFDELKDFATELFERSDNKYCVISSSLSEIDITRDQCIVNALSTLGDCVYHIIPTKEDGLKVIDSEECFNLCYKNENKVTIQIHSDCDELYHNCVSKVIKSLHDNNYSNIPLVVFCDSDLLMRVNEDHEMSKIIEMYYRHYETQPISKKDCVLLGNYLDAISFVWKTDMRKIYYQEPLNDFSIIIPVRNSIEYLRETIKTCIEQDYKGSYEILISDNTTDDNIDVLGLIQSIDSDKIRYIKTPFDLSLSRSFEYSYLNANGKYLVSIGADDGLMKTALSEMFRAFSDYPENNVFAWNRAAYIWPGVESEYSNHIFFNSILPCNKKVTVIETEQLIRKFAFREISYLYIPSMYLRTCVKRQHIEKIINATGKFENGESQDVYTGILNLFLEQKITYADYPLVISGGTTVGTGYTSLQSIDTMGKLGNRLRYTYKNYRYFNYFSRDYRNVCTLLLPYDTIMLIYSEFIKINHYNIRNFDYTENKDLIEIIHSVYKVLPDRHCDKMFLTQQLDRIAKNSNNDIYNEYLNSKVKWERQLKFKKFLRKYIGVKILRYVKDAYSKLITGSRFVNSNEVKKTVNETKIDINFNDKNINGISKAAEILFDELKSINYEIKF